jgi:imidazole glycerol-phosphate synthase subunit HisF
MPDRVRLLDRRDVDELIILDIAATPNHRGPRFSEIKQLCENLFMPVTIGGGVRNESDIRKLLAGGADKVAINTVALERPDTINQASDRFGAQAVVVSIDVKRGHVHSSCGRIDTGRDPVAWAVEVEHRGAGEILLTAIERDGMLDGYDLDLIERVAGAVSIPVIASGGCGSYQHMREAFEAGAHAVASGAAFQFTEATPRDAARFLHQHGVQVRL